MGSFWLLDPSLLAFLVQWAGSTYMTSCEVFRDTIINSGYVIDPVGTHSEFVSGLHGQKIDFDTIPKSDLLYGDWIAINANYLRTEFEQLPECIVGVANGTNRVVHSVAEALHGRVISLESYKEKDDSKKLHLQPLAAKIISVLRPNLAVVIEDVGTTGSNSVQVAAELYEAGAKNVEVVISWQRRASLEMLDRAGIAYRSIIDEPLPTFSPGDCQTLPEGFCSRGWPLKLRLQ